MCCVTLEIMFHIIWVRLFLSLLMNALELEIDLMFLKSFFTQDMRLIVKDEIFNGIFFFKLKLLIMIYPIILEIYGFHLSNNDDTPLGRFSNSREKSKLRCSFMH